MNIKCYCRTLKKYYEAECHMKTCPLCQKEPTIPVIYMDTEEEVKLVKKYHARWKKRTCKLCGKEIPKFRDGKLLKPSTYNKINHCNKECRRLRTIRDHQERLDACPVRKCIICGEIIPKEGFDYCKYIKRRICRK